MNKNMKNEFAEFLQAESDSVQVPRSAFGKIHSRLFPNAWNVAGKIAVTQAFVGFLSLAICTQFGLNPFNTEFSLAHLFMKFAGHNFCMLLCGVVFVATPYLFSNVLLSLEEIEVVKKYKWLQVGVLSLTSLGAIHFFGGEVVLIFGLLWLIGAFLGGVLSIEGSYYLRRQSALNWVRYQ